MASAPQKNMGCVTLAGLFFGVLLSAHILWWIVTGEIHGNPFRRDPLEIIWDDEPFSFILMIALFGLFAAFAWFIGLAGLHHALTKRKNRDDPGRQA